MLWPSVSITIVTYNSGPYIARCLEHLLAAEYPALEIVAVDNASVDNTRQVLASYANRIRVVFNQVNNGFAGGQNQAIRLTTGEWVLTLNPDVRLTPAFVRELVKAAESEPHIGACCGKLLMMDDGFEPLHPPASIPPVSSLRLLSGISTAAASSPMRGSISGPSTFSAPPAQLLCSAAA